MGKGKGGEDAGEEGVIVMRCELNTSCFNVLDSRD